MKKTAFRPHQRGHLTQLPKEYVDWLTQPLTRFLHIEAAAGAVLLFFTIAALVLANSPWADTFLSLWEVPIGITAGTVEFERSIREWINDALMTLFFFLVALELKREIVLGELKNPRLAVLSIAGAIGGMLVPALLYLAFQLGQPGQNGWGTVMATDTAFVIACLTLLGPRVPKSLRVFMLSLAIIDDLGAIVVVAVGYGEVIHFHYIGLAVIGFVAIKLMAVLGIRNIMVYLLVGGLIWLAVDASGMHPTVTGVIMGLMTPTERWVSEKRLLTIMGSVVPSTPVNHRRRFSINRKVLKTAEAAVREVLSPVERLEMLLHPWIGFAVMPLFAFANAGVPIAFSEMADSLYIAIFAGLVVGKPVGIILFCGLAIYTGLAIRPPELRWPYILAGGMLAGIGFTMSLFIANLALSPALVNDAKLGILSASLFAALTGIALLSWLLKRDALHNQGET
ncbi:Na+/H+ antiporter NhaA [Photobacterium lipolyticum]|uniref:Na(+)/H(+) antiporter NhaA n=1 Tax=Photobacterium lipolyticum TaxID=266810 RepID=A0A2T3MWN5_9GAMM|nr:Na+/H+ antiporter NhaA [Photobacterium lipolyticum]PSW04380.1 Na+/H+ antiporter NhaA [Photobacterium lipolyticum]